MNVVIINYSAKRALTNNTTESIYNVRRNQNINNHTNTTDFKTVNNYLIKI
jgi:hypothetical protein